MKKVRLLSKIIIISMFFVAGCATKTEIQIVNPTEQITLAVEQISQSDMTSEEKERAINTVTNAAVLMNKDNLASQQKREGSWIEGMLSAIQLAASVVTAVMVAK